MGESRAALKCLESAINDLRAWTADTDVVFPIELACEVVDAFDAWKDAGSGTDSIPKSTDEEVPPPPPGFTGERNKVIGDARDGAHTVRLVEYAFPDGSRVPYAELHETHDGARPGRVMALSALVHLAQNVTDLEVWAIGNRDQRPAEAVPPNEKERAQAERWARTHDATWCDAARAAEDSGQGSRLDVEAAAMLPLVRDARKSIDDAHVALDVEVPRQVNGRALSLVERIEILLRGQAYASNLFDKASDARDAALREIEVSATPVATDEDELAQAKRWAIAALEARKPAVIEGSLWETLSSESRAAHITAMLPIVRESRAAVDRVVDGLSVAVSEGPRLLSTVQAERDTALREIERDTAARATAELAEARREIDRLECDSYEPCSDGVEDEATSCVHCDLQPWEHRLDALMSREQARSLCLSVMQGPGWRDFVRASTARATPAPVNHPKILDGSTPLTEGIECTGIAAVWCPIHGECSCPPDADRWEGERTLDDPSCPLHAPTSTHAEDVDQPSPASLTEGIDRAALATWLRAIAAGEIDITPDVESILTAMSAALNRQCRAAPLTEGEYGPPEDEALRWAEDVLDAAKPPEEASLDMSAAARAISPLVREAQAARRAPLTEAALGVVSAWDARAKDGQPVPGGMLLIGNAIERLRNEIRLGCGGSAPLTEAACVHCSAVLPDHSPICVVVSIARDEGFPTISKAYERYASRGDIPTAVRAVEGTPPAETVTTGELWTPKVGDRVVTVSPLTASLTYRDEANAARRAGATGNVAETFVDPLGGPDDFMVRHDDGTFAPYDADELLPVPKEST